MSLMKQQVYNLKEFAARHHLESIYGAYASHIHIDDLCEKDFIEMALERTLFTKLMLVNRGNIRMGILQHGVETENPTECFRPANCWSYHPSISLLF